MPLEKIRSPWYSDTILQQKRGVGNMGSPAIEIRDLNKSFSGPKGQMSVLQGINLSVRAEEFITIVGRSGCGKSTLLRVICGLESGDSGTVERGGQPVQGPGPECGMVFQDHRLLPWLTVEDNVAFGLSALPRQQRRALAAHYLNLVGLSDYGDSYPGQLSGGMAQRAAIARGLVTKPDILLLDEPFAALDALTRIQMQGEVLRLQKDSQITMVLVTHDMDEAVFLGDRVVVMSSGPGRIQEILTVPDEARHNRSSSAFSACKARVLNYFFGAEASAG